VTAGVWSSGSTNARRPYPAKNRPIRIATISNEDQQARLGRSPLEKHKLDIELLKAALQERNK
jgi:hypothetical protein